MGWAARLADGAEQSGVIEIYTEKERDLDDGARFMRLYQHLTQLNLEGRFELVVFEQVSGGTKGRQTTLWNGYRATVMMWCAMRGIKCLPLAVTTIKKSVTGTGKGKKDGVMQAIRTLGYTVIDDNHADALGALLTVIENPYLAEPLFLVDTGYRSSHSDCSNIQRDASSDQAIDHSPVRRNRRRKVDGGAGTRKVRVCAPVAGPSAQADAERDQCAVEVTSRDVGGEGKTSGAVRRKKRSRADADTGNGVGSRAAP
jgi:Holliday junction resolvasome RuvABC endonuclease subunit